jgi:triacylglycerol esterase/lipase EstA (alpha/beta hydrolase family)
VGQIAKILKVIPVHRPEDHKKKSTGKILFESNKELKVKNFYRKKLFY